MLARNEVYTVKQSDIGGDPIETADRFFSDHMGIHKLLVVDDDDKLCGLYTLSDIERIMGEAGNHLKPARDDNFRLLCGAAISIPRLDNGEIDKNDLVKHVGEMVDKGLNLIAVSTAHGHTASVGQAIRIVRQEFKDLSIMAGNVTSGEGVDFLAESGAEIIKVGQGPGSICTTRIVAGVGIPQMSALYAASSQAKTKGVSILADGGLSKSGDIVKALTQADGVICGSLLAGCREAPGRIIEIEGKYYKQYRGMGSLEAMREGSAARYGHSSKDIGAKSTAEGIEALKEVAGAVAETINLLAGGIRSGMGYLGAKNLSELKANARFVRVTPAGQKESSPHDVIEIKNSEHSRS
jgi:IMP dehydrogenase